MLKCQSSQRFSSFYDLLYQQPSAVRENLFNLLMPFFHSSHYYSYFLEDFQCDQVRKNLNNPWGIREKKVTCSLFHFRYFAKCTSFKFFVMFQVATFEPQNSSSSCSFFRTLRFEGWKESSICLHMLLRMTQVEGWRFSWMVFIHPSTCDERKANMRVKLTKYMKGSKNVPKRGTDSDQKLESEREVEKEEQLSSLAPHFFKSLSFKTSSFISVWLCSLFFRGHKHWKRFFPNAFWL